MHLIKNIFLLLFYVIIQINCSVFDYDDNNMYSDDDYGPPIIPNVYDQNDDPEVRKL